MSHLNNEYSGVWQGQSAQLHGLTQAQRALLGTIDNSLSAVGDAESQLQGKADLPDLGTDVVSINMFYFTFCNLPKWLIGHSYSVLISG